MAGINDSMTTGQNALSTSAELVMAKNINRTTAEITNDDAAIKVYLGVSSAVTTSTGHVLKPGATIRFENYTGPIYAIAASGTPTVTFLEF
jgi:hypothetical protein